MTMEKDHVARGCLPMRLVEERLVNPIHETGRMIDGWDVLVDGVKGVFYLGMEQVTEDESEPGGTTPGIGCDDNGEVHILSQLSGTMSRVLHLVSSTSENHRFGMMILFFGFRLRKQPHHENVEALEM